MCIAFDLNFSPIITEIVTFTMRFGQNLVSFEIQERTSSFHIEGRKIENCKYTKAI